MKTSIQSCVKSTKKAWKKVKKARLSALQNLAAIDRAEGDISKTRAGARDVPLPRALYKSEPIKLTNAFHAG